MGKLTTFFFSKEKRGRGQASFELLLLVAFVFVLSFTLVSYFFQESDKTRIEAIAKSIALKELNKDANFHFINAVSYDSAANLVTFCLKPKTPELDFTVKNAIEGSVKQDAKVFTVSFVYTNEKVC
ncbi:hypothetical protein HZB88_05175 [archaeon]|nr:hypothetical protein [archaeon]